MRMYITTEGRIEATFECELAPLLAAVADVARVVAEGDVVQVRRHALGLAITGSDGVTTLERFVPASRSYGTLVLDCAELGERLRSLPSGSGPVMIKSYCYGQPLITCGKTKLELTDRSLRRSFVILPRDTLAAAIPASLATAPEVGFGRHIGIDVGKETVDVSTRDGLIAARCTITPKKTPVPWTVGARLDLPAVAFARLVQLCPEGALIHLEWGPTLDGATSVLVRSKDIAGHCLAVEEESTLRTHLTVVDEPPASTVRVARRHLRDALGVEDEVVEVVTLVESLAVRTGWNPDAEWRTMPALTMQGPIGVSTVRTDALHGALDLLDDGEIDVRTVRHDWRWVLTDTSGCRRVVVDLEPPF